MSQVVFWKKAAAPAAPAVGSVNFYFKDDNSLIWQDDAGVEHVVGAPGADGADGLSAYQVAVNNGFVGTEAEWIASLEGPIGPQGNVGPQGPAGADGADGDSAYQVAVNNGFVGTEAEWLASLEGPQGPQGDPGVGGLANAFDTVLVAGDDNVVAVGGDDLTLVAGAGIGLNSDGVAKSITFTNTSPNVVQDVFKTIAVAGQPNIVAAGDANTLTVAAGSNITLTTNAGTKTITIAASGGSGYVAGDSPTFTNITATGTLGVSGASTLASLVTITGTAVEALRVNSTAAGGPYMSIQRSGVSKGYLGTTAAIGFGSSSGDDIGLANFGNKLDLYAGTNLRLYGGGTLRLNATGAGLTLSAPLTIDSGNIEVTSGNLTLGSGSGGILQTRSGSAAAPVHSFINAPSTGAWDQGNIYSITVGGTNKSEISATENKFFNNTTTLGAGGTGTNNTALVLNAGSSAATGSYLSLKKNSVQQTAIGHESAVRGTGTSSDLLVLAEAGNGIKLAVNGSGAAPILTITSAGLSTFLNALTAGGVINANGVGDNIRFKADGTNANDGSLSATAGGDLRLGHWSGGGLSIAATTNNATLSAALTVGGNITISNTAPTFTMTDASTGADFIIDADSAFGNCFLRIDANNEVGESRLGVIIDNNSAMLLESNTPIHLGNDKSGGYPSIGYNFRPRVTPASGGYRYDINDSSSRIEFYNGGMRFFSAPSGTAGANITYTGSFEVTSAGVIVSGTHLVNGTGVVARFGTVGNGAANAITVDGDAAGSPYVQFNQNGVGKAYIQYDNTDSALILGLSAQRARISSSGFLKASNDGTYQQASGNAHEFRNNAGDWTMYITNKHATTPYGMIVVYTAATPNGTSNDFFYFSDATALRAEMRSNGGLANYSANDVNLSDAEEKLTLPMPSFIDEWEKINWKRYFLKDQTHTDFNYGYTAQDIYEAFKDKAPELVTMFDDRRLGVHEADLHNIGGAVLTELIKKFKALEAACIAAGITPTYH